MTKKGNIYESIAKRTGGDVYIGVVGPVRSGKSTFVREFMEKTVLPAISDEALRTRTRDELPLSGGGRTVTTAEPKFIPESGAVIKTDGGVKMNVRMVDCVGYLVEGAIGGDEEGAPRMVSTPWSEEKMEFPAAARLGTDKVMREHSTVGVVVTADGSFGEIPRSAFAEVEGEVIAEMKKCNKPFVILLNSAEPHSESAQKLGASLEAKYSAPVALVNCASLEKADVEGILSLLLSEFPVSRINIDMPKWVTALEYGHPLREGIYRAVKAAASEIEKVGEVRTAFEMGIGEESGAYFEDAYVDLAGGEATVTLGVPEEKYFEVLSGLSGMNITSDGELFEAFCMLARAKADYDKVAAALEEVDRKGYGIVMPTAAELTLKEPQIAKQAGGYGVKICAVAKSIHMIKADVEAEVNPIVGSEAQSEELVRSLRETLEKSPEKIWDINMFGRSLYELVGEGLRTKLAHIPEESQKRLSETLERIINEGSGGVICIIL